MNCHGRVLSQQSDYISRVNQKGCRNRATARLSRDRSFPLTLPLRVIFSPFSHPPLNAPPSSSLSSSMPSASAAGSHSLRGAPLTWRPTKIMNMRDLSRDDDFLSHLLVEKLGTGNVPLCVHKMDPSRRLPKVPASDLMTVVRRVSRTSTCSHAILFISQRIYPYTWIHFFCRLSWSKARALPKTLCV